ncbi:MAG: hypothetical protein OEZ06_24455 [Myxococcales bacterium]|nr:hypothetical protein [Myxococcales bacterium]
MAALLPLLLSCTGVPDFAEPHLIDRPRVLSLVAEPPEIAPGQSATLSILTAGGAPGRARFRVCGGFFAIVGSRQFDEGESGGAESGQGCGAEGGLELGEGAEVELPAALSAALFGDLELAAAVLGSVLPPETVELIRSQVGLPLLVEARIETDGGVLRAIKRVLVSENPRPHHNPPPPHFDFGDLEIETDAATPFHCRAVSGEPVRARAGERIEIAPIVAGDGEDWLESYRIIDARGELSERQERAFYGYFVSAGRLDEGLTEAPLRNDRWRLPAEPGCEQLWMVLRDGHGGQSACQLDVEVIDVDADGSGGRACGAGANF